MNKKVFLLLAGILVFSLAKSQHKGSIQIKGDSRVSNLVDTHIEFNEKVKTIVGYRIQIASLSGGNSKSSAFALKQKFMKEYPDMTVYVIFNEPNFQVKVGDFISRLDAYVFLQQIKKTYPEGFIIHDNVYPIRWKTEDLIPENENDLQ